MGFWLVTNNSEDKLKIVRPVDKATIRIRPRDTIRTDWYPKEVEEDNRFYVVKIEPSIISDAEVKKIREEAKEKVEELKRKKMKGQETMKETKSRVGNIKKEEKKEVG